MTKVETVYSPVFDKDIQKNLQNSPVWKEAYKEDEIEKVNKQLYVYKIKFDGLKPIQVTKMNKHKR